MQLLELPQTTAQRLLHSKSGVCFVYKNQCETERTRTVSETEKNRTRAIVPIPNVDEVATRGEITQLWSPANPLIRLESDAHIESLSI